MTPFERFFDGRLFVINLGHRKDRREHYERQFAKFGLTTVERFEAIVVRDELGRINGNSGCTASHRALLELQFLKQWPRMFVFEDDFELIYEDFAERFARFAHDLPSAWDFCYIGGHFAEPPISRVSPNVIRAGRLLTTSSYGVTLAQATLMAPHIHGGPIDSLYGGFHRAAFTYISDPVMALQFPNFSDLQERESDNSQSMLDRTHAKMV